MATRSVAIDTLLTRLAPVLGERLRTDAEALAKVGGDESGLPAGTAAAAAWPVSRDEVVALAREAFLLGVPLVPRGAGTGKAGACIPGAGEVVVDFSRMNRIRELRPDDLFAVVEPGVVNQTLDQAASEHGFMYPPDPGSFESCTLGGNVATNAGGMRAVKYGVTRRYVWGVELVLASGEILRLGRRSIKGVGGLDLTSLVVGSEGTLGFITEATLHIIPAPPAVETAWLTFADVLAASRAADRIFARGHVPRMMEVMDAPALAAIRPLAEVAFPERAGACLLIETDGPEGRALDDLLAIAELATDAGALESAIARKEKDREAMRRARRLVSSSLKERFARKIADDVAVPRSRMGELFARAAELALGRGIPWCAYGHLGDGNLHLNLLCTTEEERRRAEPVRRELLALTVALGGSISGEHGIGLAKRDVLTLELPRPLLALQEQVKAVLDPKGLMNPGKVFPPTKAA
jgi:glycolate oxidase